MALESKALTREVSDSIAREYGDDAKPLDNDAHEQFAILRAQGRSLSAAYREAINPGAQRTAKITGSAWKLAKSLDGRISCLRAEAEATLKISVVEIAEGYKAIHEAGMERNEKGKPHDLKAANAALRNLADLAGHNRPDSGLSAPAITLQMQFGGSDGPVSASISTDLPSKAFKTTIEDENH